MNKIIFKYYDAKIEIDVLESIHIERSISDMEYELHKLRNFHAVIENISKYNGFWGALLQSEKKLDFEKFRTILKDCFSEGEISDYLFSEIENSIESYNINAVIFQMASVRFLYDLKNSNNKYPDQLIYTL